MYGISQNLDTKDYIIVLEDGFCERCDKQYTDITDKWCKQCQINDLKENFGNWTSKNKIIDELIQEMQLKIDDSNNVVIEWIPYNQFDNIKETGKVDFAAIYLAIWKDGPLYYDMNEKKYLRAYPNKPVALKLCTQDITIEFLNEV